ncbi:MAG TPA: hypothetical protein VGD52_17365 [Pseudoduganella sp.]
MALALALCAPAFGAERCATGPRIEGRYTIDAQGFAVRSSARMKLVAVCNYRKDKSLGGMGTFRFEGNAEVSGKLWRESGDSLGEVLWFTADEASAAEVTDLAFMLNSMRLSEKPKAKKVLPLAGDDNCRMAKAKLRIRWFDYVAGPGVDEDGPFLLGYEIIRIGKSKKCVFN